MNCREYEPLIALYVEGDLSDREVELHLAECSDCRQLLEDLRASQAVLKGLAPVDTAFLSAVRSGVLAKLESRRRTVLPWIAAFAAAIALIVAFLMPPRKSASIAKAPVLYGGADPLVHSRLPGRPSAVAKVTQKTRRSRPGGRRRTRGSAPPAEPLVVKMLTGDPNIVIIWLVNQPGD
jgi:putative zinc finger protein